MIFHQRAFIVLIDFFAVNIDEFHDFGGQIITAIIHHNNFTAISGETNKVFVATATGNYALEVSENGCTDTSTCYVHASLGTSDLGMLKDVKVFPNPNNGTFNVSVANTQKHLQLTIFDIYGKVIVSKSYTNVSEMSLDLSQQPIGIYLVRLVSNGNSVTNVRVVKN